MEAVATVSEFDALKEAHQNRVALLKSAVVALVGQLSGDGQLSKQQVRLFSDSLLICKPVFN